MAGNVNDRIAELKNKLAGAGETPAPAKVVGETPAPAQVVGGDRISQLREKLSGKTIAGAKTKDDEDRIRLENTDIKALDRRIKELEDYLRQTKIDLSLPWEKQQKELDELKRQREMARSAQYDAAGAKALADLDAGYLETLDKLLAGAPKDDGVQMQGIADNRSWEEIYAEDEAYLEGLRAELRAGGYDDKEIAQLLDYRQRQKNRENYEAEVAEAVEYAEDHEVGASIKSVGQNLTGGLGYVSLAVQNAHNKLTGKDRPLDYYTPEMLGTAKAQAARETVSKDMGKVGAFLYNTGMSMADSAAIMGMAALGIPPAAGSVLLGGTAATSAAMEAKKRGVSDDQALLTGLAAGTFEALFEKVSLDKVVSGKVVAGEMRDRVVQTLKNIGIQSGVEGSEEFFTSVANTMVDNIINGGMSELNTMKRELMANGYSEAEADKLVTEQWAKSLALDFIGGAISGGVFGGVSTGFQTMALDGAYSELYGDRSAQLTAEAMEINGESKAAQRAAQRIAEGKKPTAAQVRTMAEAVEKSVREENEESLTYAVSAVETRLDSLGELGDTEKIAEAVVEMVRPSATANGRAAAQKVLESSTQGQRALRELRGTMKTVDDRLYAAEGKTINPNAKDKRAVTGVKFNAKTKKMDAIVKKEDGGTETVPLDTSSATMRQMRLAEAAEQYGESGSVMVAGIRDDQDTDTYMGRWNLAYEYGKGGVPKEKALASELVRYLRPEQAEMAYEEGAKVRAAEGQKKAAEQQAARQGDIKRGEGTVSMEGAVVDGVRYNAVSSVGLSKKQKAAIDVMRLFAKTTGVNVVFYESDVNEQGMRAQANGMYRDGVIYLDVAAGVNGEDMTDAAILRTAAHELTHFIQDFSQEEYDAIKDFMLGKLAESKGVSVERLIADKMQREAGSTPEKAVDELIADGCEMMLKNESWLQELQETEPGIAKKILNFLKRWLANLHRAFVGVEAQSAEAKAMLAHMDELQALWNRGLASAVDTYRRTNENTAEDGGVAEDIGVGVDEGTDSAAPTMFSERTWTESDYVTARNAAAKEIADAIGVSERKAKAYIDDINSIAKLIADDRTRLDYFSSPLRSSFVSNVEYGGSFDFSTLCKKRRLLTGTFTAIQKALPNTALTAEEILDIRNRMKEKGLEVSCGLCYVEGSRANMGQFAKEFLKLYKKYYPDAWQPNMADVNTPEGIEWVRINHPECYEQYEYFWNHYGTLKSGDKNLFASQQKPKLYQLRTEYKGEVLEHFRKGENVEEKNRNGGIRLQSFSDFEIVHLIDCMQIIMDMSRVGLAGQAYTKVPDFAWALGDTGLKINLSLIAKGVDENGKLIFDDVEGMPIDEAMKIRDRYSKNVGTILVAFNDEQLLAALADDRVDFVIPFHRSQWKKAQYAAMGLPAKTKDYTFMQNEKYIRPQYHEYRGRMVRDKATNYMPNEYWDFSKSGKENAIAYLEMCARNNKRPKFYKLLKDNGDGSYSLKEDGSTDGYWKLLIDFKMYDNKGKGSPQMPVKPVFNMAEAKRMLENYEGGHGTFPVARGVVDEFVADYKAKHGGKTQYSARRTEKNTAEDGGVMQYQGRTVETDAKITEAMSDEERTELLKSKTILAPVYSGEADGAIEVNREDLESQTKKLIKKALVKIGDEFGVFTGYKISDVDVEITLSKNNLEESASKEISPIQLAKLLPILKKVVENSVGIESHSNRYYYDNSTVRFENLVGGYFDGDYFIPVRFGLKHSNTRDVTLYVIVDQNKIDAKKIKAEVINTPGAQEMRSVVSLPAFSVNLSQIFKYVNSEDLLRYIPDGMLTEKQRKIKWEAVAKTVKKTNNKNDSHYKKFLGDKNVRAAENMVNAAAKAAGYTVKAYHGTNGGIFYEFDWKKTQRADAGWYGRGHYFATRKGEAAQYGERVIPVVLKIDKPFNFGKEIFVLNGVDMHRGKWSNVVTGNVAFAINMAEKFPSIFGNKTVSAYNNSTYEGTDLRWNDMRGLLEEFMSDENFRLVRFSDGTYKWMYEKKGDWRTYSTYDQYATKEDAVEAKQHAAANILFSQIYNIQFPLSPEAYYLGGDMNAADAFSAELIKRGYDAVLQASDGDEIVVFNGKNIKSAEPITYDDNGQIIPISERFDKTKTDIRYSARDTTAITDREILAHTLDSAAQTQAEKTLLERYRAHAEELRKLEGQITYYRNRLKAVENGTAKMSETEKTKARNRINSYARLADREETMLRSLAKKDALQAVLGRERSYIEEQGGSVDELKARYEGSLEQKVAELWGQARTWERKYKEAIDNMPMTDKRSEREKMKKLREDIRKKGGRLIRMLETNTDKLHVPEELKEPLGAFLDTIAFRGKNSGGTPAEYAQRLNALAVAIGKKMATVKGRDGETAEGYLDLPQYFRERVEYHAEMAESLMRGAKPYEAVVSRLGLEELQDLDMILSVLSKSIKGINELHTNKHFATVEKAAEDTKRTLKSLGQYEAKGEKLEGYLSWKNILPEYAFRKFGEGGKSIFEALQDGWDKLAFNAAKVIRFTEETYTSKEAEAWNRELHEVELISEGEPVTVQMSAAQIMSLWALSRRKQALGHLLQGGIKLEDIEIRTRVGENANKIKLERGKTIHTEATLHMKPEHIAKITKLLSSRQLEVAQKLQKFMETQGGAWGNEVSMERHGYNFFGEQNYFPIETYDAGRAVNKTEQARENEMFRLLNLSATKPLEKEAKNTIIVRNIFDVYSNHMADMAKYNALALPILDAIKWFNFNTRTESTEGFVEDKSVHDAIKVAYGVQAKNYVAEFLKDLNGVKEGSERGAGLAKNMVSRYKRAQIAANLRVAFLQPTAIVRALAVIQPKYLLSAAAEKTKLTEAVKEMQANSGIALWKSMGFFDTDVGRSMREQIRGTQSTYDKAMDKTMIAAEKADELTWAVLWKACKAEVAEKQKLEGDALIKATAKRFRDVIYSTQVVDSTMTRSGLMRSTNFFDKTMTSFMSEPTVTYNMVMGAVDEVRNDARRIGAKEAIKKHSRKLATAFTTYAVSALAVSLVETLADVWRDDDDETFWEKFQQAMFGQGGVQGFLGSNLVSNLNPLNLIPGASGVMSFLEGYAPSRMEYGGIMQAVKSAQQLWEAFAVRTGIQEKPTAVTYYGNITGYGLFYNASKAVSYLSGAPLSNISREVIAVWNNLCGMAGWDKLKAATYENKKDAANRRIWNAMVENDAAAVEEEKEKMVQTAMDGGEPQRTAVSAANSRVRSIVRDNYWEGEAKSGDVERYLQRYGGMTAEEAAEQRKEWDCYIETGIKFGDIREAYETGQIGEADVVRMRTKYGGDTAEEAYDKVLVYDWAIENPLYADIGETDAVGYYEHCERAGIGARLYYEAANETKGATKQEHVDYILSLGLSYSQSKALWLALKTKSWKDTGTPWE